MPCPPGLIDLLFTQKIKVHASGMDLYFLYYLIRILQGTTPGLFPGIYPNDR